MKAGWKTTEFWVVIITQILGILLVMGVITPEQSDALTKAIIMLGGLIASVASAFGYSLSRAKVKASEK